MEDCSGKKGVKCPNHACKDRYVWDWCQDVYVNITSGGIVDDTLITGITVNKKTKVTKMDRPEVSLAKCCSCGGILSVLISDDIQGDNFCYNHPNWGGVDWEDENNAMG